VDGKPLAQKLLLDAVTAHLVEVIAAGLNLLAFLHDIDRSCENGGSDGGDGEDNLEMHFGYRLL
jgi:hypothetical protein